MGISRRGLFIMLIKNKINFKSGADIISKGSIGVVIGISNSNTIKDAFPNQPRPNDWFYMAKFNEIEYLCELGQIEF